MQPFDWLSSSVEERKLLYQNFKIEMNRLNMRLYDFLKVTIGHSNFGQDYDSVLRSGRYNRRYAESFFQWLADKNPERANLLLETIISRRTSETEAWDDLLNNQSHQEELGIIPYKWITTDRGGRVAGFRRKDEMQKLNRGELFFLSIISDFSGAAIGVQKYQSFWYPLPLCRSSQSVFLQEGENDLPRNTSNPHLENRLDPLCEETDKGTFEYVIIQCKDAKTLKISDAEHNENFLLSSQLNAFATSLKSETIQVFKKSVLVI